MGDIELESRNTPDDEAQNRPLVDEDGEEYVQPVAIRRGSDEPEPINDEDGSDDDQKQPLVDKDGYTVPTTNGRDHNQPLVVEDGEVYIQAIAIRREPVEEENIDVTLPPLYRLVVALFSIVSYVGGYVLDVLLLKQYYGTEDWLFFWITFSFILVPSIIIQLLSWKWFQDDNHGLKPWSIVLHVFMMGPVERYWLIIKYGRKARAASAEDIKPNKVKYLANWRDASMLRFLYAFLETGPQVTVQLYVLLQFQLGPHEGNMTDVHFITMLKVVASVASLSLSMVSYNDDLRMSEGDELSIPGFVVQIIYRLLIIASRILTLVLFTMLFKVSVIPVLLIHWLLMACWIQGDNTKFFTSANGKCNDAFEVLFKILMGFIYMYCYITTAPGPTLVKQATFYLLFYLENVSMMIAWIWFNERSMDNFEVSAIAIVFGTMVLGLLLLLAYYKVFHPNVKRKKDGGSAGDRELGAASAGKAALFGRVGISF